MVRFPPQKSHDTFCPPISRFPTRWGLPETDPESCMLGSGCLSPFFFGRTIYLHLKCVLRWVFVNLLKRAQKWVKTGLLVLKVGQNVSKPTFASTFTHLGH